jgi:hypothetical protein
LLLDQLLDGHPPLLELKVSQSAELVLSSFNLNITAHI